jgi:hypothetical protein
MYRGIKEFKGDYQPINNLVKDENGDLLAYANNIVNRWKSSFYLLLNVHNVTDIPGSSHLEVEIAIAKL